MDEMIEKMARALHKAHGDRYTDIVDWDMLMPWMKDRWLSHARQLIKEAETTTHRLAVVEKEGKLPNKYDELNTEISMIYNMGYMNAQRDMLKDHWVKEATDATE